MENKANYALIGVFVLAALAATLGFILWLTGSQFDQQFDEYQVAFQGPVRGLSPGSEVRFNGIGVGEVTNIRLDRDDPNTVLSTIRIDANTPVDTKSYAQLEPLGLTGLNYLQIFAGGENYTLIKNLPDSPDVPRIEGRSDALSEIIEGGGSAVEQAQLALTQINRLFSDEAVSDVHGILSNINRITDELDASDFDMKNVNRLISDLGVTVREVGNLATAAQNTLSLVDGVIENDVSVLMARAQTTMDEVDSLLNALEDTAGNADELIVDTRDAVNRLSNSGLTDLEETVDAIRRLVLSLGRVADALEQSPLAFISGTEADVVELPQ
ncbi:ABC transporter substrate-binding protein [Algimonas arctica]|uniref:ABC transporter substrate-binding protein n=1 Tax=Algimonas arctica TaxID=1479486 RepID=A0A8J3CN72_9PROT|nr:MlaD family protein [Algimonas arctica]GHA83110.1 ABC transporter substrate-binding protein [Algimonas arctica]